MAASNDTKETAIRRSPHLLLPEKDMWLPCVTTKSSRRANLTHHTPLMPVATDVIL